MSIEIIRAPIGRAHLRRIAEAQFGDMVKAVVDIERGVMAIAGEMHSDEEAALLDDGSSQRDLWGINLLVEEQGPSFVEFDSMINVRPSQGNRTRSVESAELQGRIRALVSALVTA